MDFLATRARRRILFAALYASEGAPIGFLWWALPTILRARGVPVDEITTLTSVIVLPWAFKFAWAPLIDVLRFRWPLKSWILTSQSIMGVSLLPLLFLNLESPFPTLTIVLLVHAFAAATQDVSIDALCIGIAGSDERGALNGWMQAGMLTSRSLLGGGALVALDAVGWAPVIVLLLGVIWSSSLLLLFSRVPLPVSRTIIADGSTISQFVPRLRTALTRKSTWLALTFALFSGAAFEAVGAVAGPFLVDQGYSTSEVGWFFLVPAVACTIAGSVTGGWVSDRMPRTMAVSIFLALVAGSVVFLAVLDHLNASASSLLAAIAMVYFCLGLFVAASYALYMDLTDPGLGATQFSAYMGATNLCESWSSFAVGRFVGSAGYSGGFLIMAAVSLLSFPIIWALRSLQPAEEGRP